jgi:hypothetical protein
MKAETQMAKFTPLTTTKCHQCKGTITYDPELAGLKCMMCGRVQYLMHIRPVNYMPKEYPGEKS